MKKRAFGSTGLEVSEIGFDGWAIGGDEHPYNLGPAPEQEARRAIDAALEGGVTFFDTADVYGFGRSERLLGEAFAACGHRSSLAVATKTGFDFGDPALPLRYSPEFIRTSLERSLGRLRMDYVDVFQLLSPPREVIASPEVQRQLKDLKRQKMTRFLGITVDRLDQCEAAMESGLFDAVQMAWSVVDQLFLRRASPVLSKTTAVIARDPFAQGFLTGQLGPGSSLSPGDWRGTWPLATRNACGELSTALREYFQKKRKTRKSLREIALQFALAEPRVGCVIVDMRTPTAVAEALRVPALKPLALQELRWLGE